LPPPQGGEKRAKRLFAKTSTLVCLLLDGMRTPHNMLESGRPYINGNREQANEYLVDDLESQRNLRMNSVWRSER
jgi:hypothetical protein